MANPVRSSPLVEVVFRSTSVLASLSSPTPSATEVIALLPSLDIAPDASILWRGHVYTGEQTLPLLPPHGARLLVQGSLQSEVHALALAAETTRVRNDLAAVGKRRGPRKRHAPLKCVAPEGWRYGFGAIETLNLPDERNARRCLHAIARHPGVLAVMRARRWFVPVLAELPATGKVGIDPACLLGLNVNSGSRIELRVRTDDHIGVGFRKFESIMATVWHELAHNAIGPHTPAFFALVSVLTREGAAHDWRTSRGHLLGGARAATRLHEWDELASSSDSSGDEEATGIGEGVTLGGVQL